ncbi:MULTISPECIES: hypothetical protein [Cupriavidus]|uniref:Oligosaccharide repeat unit polymerase n=1 Tax=Cupriavidus pauculus TaxID=82633 RepID=A0A3G8H2B1_9BURK|nr:hypothetical protein [Cupriavidus pauculus]AZG13622.1 hypothetical protein EHF44_09255 [Cupriavidus pauculus]
MQTGVSGFLASEQAWRATSVGVRFAPLVFFCGWTLLPLFLIFWGPFDFRLSQPDALVGFIFACVLAFAMGYVLFASTAAPRVELAPAPHPWINRLFLGACLLSVMLIEPSIYAYTGKHVWQVESVLNQREVYLQLLTGLEQSSPLRKVMSALRGLAAPIVLLVLPTAAVYWPDLDRLARRAVLGVVACFLLFSLFRGTDKEMGDLLVFFFVGLGIAAGFRAIRGIQMNVRAFRRGNLLAVGVVLVFVTLFTLRKAARMQGALSFCLYNDVACFTVDSGSDIINLVRFAFGMLTAYLSQGYYGLSLALNTDYNWTYGIGHSSFLVSFFSSFIDTDAIYKDGLMYALRASGWDDRYVWSSAFPWLASDLTFWGVPPLMFLIGAIYSRAWMAAIAWRSLSGIMVFALLSIFIVYLPANNQLAQSPDYYVATVVWLAIFVLEGVRNVSRKDFVDHGRNRLVR